MNNTMRRFYRRGLLPRPEDSPARGGSRDKPSPTTQILALAACLLLSACATSPDRSAVPEIDHPSAWTTQSSNQAPTAWLEDFASPELEALIAEAIANNPNLEATAARFTESLAEAQIAGADLMPSAGLGLKGTRQQISTFGPTSTGGVIFENYDLSLNVSWELDIWGRLRDRTAAALAQAEARIAELRGAKLSLAAQTTKSWFNVIEANQQFDFAESTAQSYAKDQQTLESRFKRGLNTGFEVRRIRTLAANSLADVANRQRGLDVATRNLEILLGRYPEGELIAEPLLPSLPKQVPAGLPAELLERRPDLIAAERQLAATEKELTASKKDRLPQISLTASTGNSTQVFDDLLDGDFSVWSLAGNLAQPIFQGGRLIANVDRNASIRDQAAANYRDIALRAFLEVETTLAAEAYFRNEYKSLRLAAEEAVAAEALAREQYRNGIGDFTGTLDALRSADVAQSRLLSLRNRLLQNRIDLYLALGGSFSNETTFVGASLETPAEAQAKPSSLRN